MTRRLELDDFAFLQEIHGLRETERGIEAQLGDERLRVDVIQEDVVRLSISRRRVFERQPTLAVHADVSAVPDFSVENSKRAMMISTARMSIAIHKKPFELNIYRADNTLISQSRRGRGVTSQTYGVNGNAFVLVRECETASSIFGLGQKTGRLERRGRNYILWNTDVASSHATKEFTEWRLEDDPAKDPSSTCFDPYYVSIPFFYQLDGSGAASGFFLDNGFRGRFEFTHSDKYVIHFEGGQYTEYILSGPAMEEVLYAYTWLTGRMQPPPLWALGHHQCRWYPYSSDSLIKLAETYRSKDLPCDALWLDIDHMEGYRVFTWSQERFPHPELTLSTLSAMGFRAVGIVDPGIKVEDRFPIYAEGCSDHHFCRTEEGTQYMGRAWPGAVAFPDFVQERTREWWGRLIAKHMCTGLSGIWNDMNEPATGDVNPRLMRFEEGRQAHDRFHNQYGLLMAMATQAGLNKLHSQVRHFVLSRAGSAGIQRCAANWLGDNCSRWEHLWMSIPMAMGLGISGQPFVGADVGGFAEDCTAELLARWYQYGALTPFFRNHACRDTIDQYPWSFGKDIERICREAIRLRYRLLPYLYTAFIRSTETGQPVQMPLVYKFQDDPQTRRVDDQYLLGEHLLVAPVCSEYLYEREVYFPRGTWLSWHTDEVLRGPHTRRVEAPKAFIPLFARGGSIIPTWPDPPLTTMGFQPDVIDLHVFIPSEEEYGETLSLLHEDDGLTLGFLEDACYRTMFSLTREREHIKITASVAGDGYAEFRRSRFRLIFHGGTVSQFKFNDRPMHSIGNILTVENRGEGFLMEARI